MPRHPVEYALIASIIILGMMAISMPVIRPVAAEDDCLPGTYAIKRLPMLGTLVCVWEPWP